MTKEPKTMKRHKTDRSKTNFYRRFYIFSIIGKTQSNLRSPSQYSYPTADPLFIEIIMSSSPNAGKKRKLEETHSFAAVAAATASNGSSSSSSSNNNTSNGNTSSACNKNAAAGKIDIANASINNNISNGAADRDDDWGVKQDERKATAASPACWLNSTNANTITSSKEEEAELGNIWNDDDAIAALADDGGAFNHMQYLHSSNSSSTQYDYVNQRGSWPSQNDQGPLLFDHQHHYQGHSRGHGHYRGHGNYPEPPQSYEYGHGYDDRHDQQGHQGHHGGYTTNPFSSLRFLMPPTSSFNRMNLPTTAAFPEHGDPRTWTTPFDGPFMADVKLTDQTHDFDFDFHPDCSYTQFPDYRNPLMVNGNDYGNRPRHPLDEGVQSSLTFRPSNNDASKPKAKGVSLVKEQKKESIILTRKMALHTLKGVNSKIYTNSKKHVTINFDNLENQPFTPPSATSSISEIKDLDVLCGRGGNSNIFIGNCKYRALIKDFRLQYLFCKRREKPLIAKQIVYLVRKRGGRFLTKDDNGAYAEIGDKKAIAKTAQALREGLNVRMSKLAFAGIHCMNDSAL